jgi:transcriptional regulator GlxA family with amidase domain
MVHTNAAGTAKKRVVVLAFPQLVLLDLVGPCEVFSAANRIYRRLHPGASDPYGVEVVSAGAQLEFHTSCGVAVLAGSRACDCHGEIDTLLVPGGLDLTAVINDAALLGWLRQAALQARRLGSICTGAFILAAARLLDGRCATTHWEFCEKLAADYPGIRVDPNRIYVRDGNVYTSAGVTAGMDLALALIEDDLGRDVALEVSRSLVMFVRRQGGQSQLSVLLDSQTAEPRPLRDLVLWAAEHPDADLSVEAMAARVNMSVRNFSRLFRKGLGRTPARFVEQLRVEAARRMLEATDARLDHIAGECGLGSGNSMLRSFVRLLGVPPSEYRERSRRLSSDRPFSSTEDRDSLTGGIEKLRHQ